MIRLYGHLRGESSFVQVTRGMRAAADSAGLLAGTVALDDPEPGEQATSGADAAVALHCGAPLGVRTSHLEGMHQQHWLMLAPNSEGIPPMLARKLDQPIGAVEVIDGKPISVERPLLTGLLAPSAWAGGVLAKAFPDHMIRVSPHGVHPDVHKPVAAEHLARREEYKLGIFRVAHFTSTLGQRKSTVELLKAWAAWENRPAGAMLLIVANPLAANELLWRVRDIGVQGAHVVPNPEAPAGALAEALRYAHVVCQPSRGEGFGLCPLEARACGTPVVATLCTGHAQHMSAGSPGVVVVEHGPLRSMDDYPGSVAPEVAPGAILHALRRAHESWAELSEATVGYADTLRFEWSWQQQNAPVLQRIVDDAG